MLCDGHAAKIAHLNQQRFVQRARSLQIPNAGGDRPLRFTRVLLMAFEIIAVSISGGRHPATTIKELNGTDTLLEKPVSDRAFASEIGRLIIVQPVSGTDSGVDALDIHREHTALQSSHVAKAAQQER